MSPWSRTRTGLSTARCILISERGCNVAGDKASGVDLSAGNAGERPTGSKAAPLDSVFAKRQRCRYHTRIAILVVRRAAEHCPNGDVDSALELSEKALVEALRRMREA